MWVLPLVCILVRCDGYSQPKGSSRRTERVYRDEEVSRQAESEGENDATRVSRTLVSNHSSEPRRVGVTGPGVRQSEAANPARRAPRDILSDTVRDTVRDTHDASIIKVHIVAHSHDDAGWLKTVDQLLLGQRNEIQKADVSRILDSVIDALNANADRTFSYVEQAFFQRWWAHQLRTNHTKVGLLRKFVKEGRFTFLNGGWVMHDEAAPSYIDMIDQTALGHKFLLKEFGVRPRIGWQIDPFGHSEPQSSLFGTELGFDGLFFGRLDYRDNEYRRRSKAAEFQWRSQSDHNSTIFTGLTGSYLGNYGPPPGFCWDVTCSDPQFVDEQTGQNLWSSSDPASPEYTLNLREHNEQIVESFRRFALAQARETRGDHHNKHILMTFGSDFHYMQAEKNYINSDELIRRINEGEDSGIKAFYSTVEAYVDEKKRDALASVSFPVKDDGDFFPYGEMPAQGEGFWTGFFTSRPAFKRQIRDFSSKYQAFKTFDALQALSNQKRRASRGSHVEVENRRSGDNVLLNFADAIGIAQHHDAITGTAKQHVTFDYQKRLHAGYASAWERAKEFLSDEVGLTDPKQCLFINETRCDVTQKALNDHVRGNKVTIVVWNNLGNPIQTLVEIPVPHANIAVYTGDGLPLPGVEVLKVGESFSNYGLNPASSTFALMFEATLPPLGYSLYEIRSIAAATQTASANQAEESANRSSLSTPDSFGELMDFAQKPQGMTDVKDGAGEIWRHTLENDFLRLEFERGTITKIHRKAARDSEEITMRVTQRWVAYRGIPLSKAQIDTGKFQPSGAYILRPESRPTRETTTVPQNAKDAQNAKDDRSTTANEVELFPSEFSILGGTEVHIKYQDGFVRQKVRLFGERVEIVHTTGPLPDGVELVSRWDTDVESSDTFYTDANGRQMMRRTRNGDALKYHGAEYYSSRVEEIGNTRENEHLRMYDSEDAREEFTGKFIEENTKQSVTDNSIEESSRTDDSVGRNFYPAAVAAEIRDRYKRLTVLTDAPQGVSSLKEGSLEVMVHRDCIWDDFRGVGEPLRETRDMESYGQRMAVKRVFKKKHLKFSPPRDAWRQKIQVVGEKLKHTLPDVSFSEASDKSDHDNSMRLIVNWLLLAQQGSVVDLQSAVVNRAASEMQQLFSYAAELVKIIYGDETKSEFEPQEDDFFYVDASTGKRVHPGTDFIISETTATREWESLRALNRQVSESFRELRTRFLIKDASNATEFQGVDTWCAHCCMESRLRPVSLETLDGLQRLSTVGDSKLDSSSAKRMLLRKEVAHTGEISSDPTGGVTQFEHDFELIPHIELFDQSVHQLKTKHRDLCYKRAHAVAAFVLSEMESIATNRTDPYGPVEFDVARVPKHTGPKLIATGKFWLNIGRPEDDRWRKYIDEIFWKPQLFFGRDEFSFLNKRGSTVVTFLQRPLPEGLQIVSLETLPHFQLVMDPSLYREYRGARHLSLDYQTNDERDSAVKSDTVESSFLERNYASHYLVRLAHQFGENDITLDFKTLFRGTKVLYVAELNLSGNQERDKMPSWLDAKPVRGNISSSWITTFRPNEIRTFGLSLVPVRGELDQ